jgi:hypothetical protein
MRSSVSVIVSLVALGCARESRPPAPPAPLAPAPPGYAWPPQVLGQPLARVPVAPATPASVRQAEDLGAPEPVLSASEIPSGEACLNRLVELGIQHHKLDARKGVETPIVVTGPLGGIEYVAGAGLPFEADCRLAIALNDVGPILVDLGVEKLRYSGVYTYRMSKAGRLSLHAYGLAIDVHAAFAEEQWHEVKTDYQAGLAESCTSSAPLLNRVKCQLERTQLFKELITPDDNADHRDHLHLAIAPTTPPPAAEKPEITAKK